MQYICMYDIYTNVCVIYILSVSVQNLMSKIYFLFLSSFLRALNNKFVAYNVTSFTIQTDIYISYCIFKNIN